MLERTNGHLDVDAILGGQAGHRGRADMVDAKSQIAEDGAELSCDGGEVFCPARAGRHDLDHVSIFSEVLMAGRLGSCEAWRCSTTLILGRSRGILCCLGRAW